MPSGGNNRKLTSRQIEKIVQRYITPLPDGTWEGTTALAQDFGVRPATINRWLRLRGVQIRSARAAHSGGKRCKPIRNVPRGSAPVCKCGCSERTAWNRRKNRWNAYAAGHYRGDAPYKSEAWLRAEYEVKRRTLDEIAAECGVAASSVRKFMERYGIERRRASEAHVGRQAGEHNPAWKGGVAQWDYAPGWKTIARAIKDRDKWACRDCGERRTRWGSELHVHHIDGNKLNNDPLNLISLCSACHRRWHARLAKRR